MGAAIDSVIRPVIRPVILNGVQNGAQFLLEIHRSKFDSRWRRTRVRPLTNDEDEGAILAPGRTGFNRTCLRF